MKIAVRFICLTVVCVIPKINSQDSPPPSTKVPGCSACLYYGTLKESCNLPTVAVSSLPKECTSILFVELEVDANFNVSDGTGVEGNLEYFKSVTESGWPSFIYYGHPTVQDWIEAIKCNIENTGENAKEETEHLKIFLDQYPNLSGIILENLVLDLDSTNLTNFTGNFQIYLDKLRTTFPDLGIGLELNGRQMMTYYDTERYLEWMDFTVLDTYIDFYILDLNVFNRCTKKFKIGGTNPIDGDSHFTIKQLVSYATKAGIPKEKTYLGFGTGPDSIDPAASECILTNTKYCASPNNDGWCSDTTQSYYDKGAFAKENAAGFIAYEVDMDDPEGLCKCGQPYPAFYDILAGFKGDTTPAPCPLLDKN